MKPAGKIKIDKVVKIKGNPKIFGNDTFKRFFLSLSKENREELLRQLQ